MVANTRVVRPDDVCLLCSLQRDQHGDSQHKFSLDGQLIPVEQGPTPKKQPPKERADLVSNMQQSMEANAVLRLTEVLIEKGVLDGKDTLYIFSGMKSSVNPT